MLALHLVLVTLNTIFRVVFSVEGGGTKYTCYGVGYLNLLGNGWFPHILGLVMSKNHGKEEHLVRSIITTS